VQSGEAVIQVGKSDLVLRTHIGRATLLAGSEVLLTREGAGLAFAVRVGRLEFEDAQGKARALLEGDQVHLGIGMAELAEVSELPRDEASGKVSLTVKGAGTRVKARGKAAFEELAAGKHALGEGTELKLGKDAHAILERGSDRAELRGEGVYVVGSGEILLEAQRGDATLESHERDVSVQMPGGVIIVRNNNGRARLQLSARDGALEVLEGKVSAHIQGNDEELIEGDLRSWSTEPERESAAGEDGITPQPEYFNISVPVGESFVLHAPELPVSAAFDVGSRCPGEAEIELPGGSKTRGKGRVNVLLSARSRGYNVRCLNERGTLGRVIARGTVRVLLDAGTRKLPPTPPTSLADADGRTYTVYYSNQAPAVRIRWPNPPSAGSYTLSVDGKEESVSSPEHVFPSGALRDGVHEVSFRAGTRGSRTTFIDVRFDNNAPTASVEAPQNRSFNAGAAVQVAGVSLPAWKVSLEGGSVEREADGRFKGSIVPSADHPDVVVRLSHPRLGVHYYLRRAGSSQ
jgi:hypothetical protein